MMGWALKRPSVSYGQKDITDRRMMSKCPVVGDK